jgi:Short-chain alcohol dehydrogenase of unknown specificity
MAAATKNIKDLFDLTGRVAIVTGGSRGIGKEMAEGLTEAGAKLMLCARRADWLDKTVEEFSGRGFEVISAPVTFPNLKQFKRSSSKHTGSSAASIFSSTTPVFLGAKCPRTCRSISGSTYSTLT